MERGAIVGIAGSSAVIITAVMLVLVSSVIAAEARYYCVDSLTQQREAWIDTNTSGTWKTHVINESIPCEYGCDSRTSTCQPPPFQQLLIIASILIVIVGIGLLIMKWLR